MLAGLLFDFRVGRISSSEMSVNYRIISRYDPEGSTLHKLMTGNKAEFRDKCLADAVISLFANIIVTHSLMELSPS
jgi:hypothetical protein